MARGSDSSLAEEALKEKIADQQAREFMARCFQWEAESVRFLTSESGQRIDFCYVKARTGEFILASGCLVGIPLKKHGKN